MSHLKYVMSCAFLGMTLMAFSQQTIKGTVYSSSEGDLPLPGVNIAVKSLPGIGTVSDFDGNFELEVSAEAQILVFSYIGYSPLEIDIATATNWQVYMSSDAALLDEFVVTALGVERKEKSLGYSVSEIDNTAIAEARENNVINALNAKVAGVNITSTSGSPGASANIVIRGRASINDNNPLFVVDGVPIDNSYAGSNFIDHSNRAIDLNPDDIESISVLKGASATALYGVRAANGVIVITTKKGGQEQGKISFSQSLTFDQVNKIPEQQNLFAQGIEQGDQVIYLGPLETNRSWGPRIDTLRYDGDASYPYSNQGRIVGQSDPTATNTQVVPFDNPAQFFQTGITSNSHLSVQGGNDKTQYYTSFGYSNQTGVVPNSDYKRISLKLSGGTALSEKLKVSASTNYVNSGGNRMQRGSNLSGVMLGLMRSPATFDLANGLEDPVNDPLSYTFADGTPRTYWGAYDNPFWSVNKNLSQDKVNRLIGHAQINYEINSWLSALYRIGLDYYFEERKTYWDNFSNEFGTGVIWDDLYSFSNMNSDFLLNANRQIGKSFEINAAIGHNYVAQRTYNNITEGETFILPDFYDISNVAQVSFADDNIRKKRLVGTFYNIEMDYKNFLYLTVTGRWDWSSTLPIENVPFFYDSYSTSFVFTELLNLETNPYFSYGKLRLSYAKVGGDAFPYALNTYYVNRAPVRGQTSFLQDNTIGNPELKPESTSSFEVGADLRFLQNRISVDVTYYQALSKDQIISAPITYSSGFTSATVNAGEIENKGIELLVSASPVKRKDFNWDVKLNFSANENTVISLAEGVPDLSFSGSGVTSTSNRAIPGQPYGVLYGTRWLRDETGNILINDEGYPLYDPQDPGIIGDPNPDWQMGIHNAFNYKGLRLAFLIDIRKGGDIFNGTLGVMKNLGTHKSTESREEEVIYEGVNVNTSLPNDVPIRLDSDFYSRYPFAGVSEANIEDGSWVRLREINLSYRLPSTWTAKIGMDELEIGLSGRNLLLFTEYSGVDPETNLGGASNSFGREWFNSPNTRSIGIHLKAGF